MSCHLYLEGSASSKEAQIRCREGFRKLLEKMGLRGRMPRLVACGGRGDVLSAFRIALTEGSGDFVAMLIDSEGPVDDIEATWQHLAKQDGWQRPAQAEDEQVLLMTTCMESWIVADRSALKKFFGQHLQEKALPTRTRLEEKTPDEIQDALGHATRHCAKPYSKGKRSFEILAQVEPGTLGEHLPSFVRTKRILEERL